MQVISAVLRDPSDKTELRLLFANQSEEDILCRKELDELAAKHPQLKARWAAIPGRLRVHWQACALRARAAAPPHSAALAKRRRAQILGLGQSPPGGACPHGGSFVW